jgi:glutathione peroxidase
VPGPGAARGLNVLRGLIRRHHRQELNGAPTNGALIWWFDPFRGIAMSDNLLNIPVQTIKGEQKTLADYAGKAVLVVNTASKCGFTPQYKGLEELWQSYKDRGLVVLGFPCNQFGKQEPGNEGAISEFCELNYGVSFPLFKKIDVNGSDAHPLFVQLKKRAPGLLGSEGIKWNFTKFLIGRDGTLIKRYAPLTKPEELKSDIEALLK